MAFKFPITPEQLEFLARHGNTVHTKGKKFIYVPYWIEILESGREMHMYSLNSGGLPEELTAFIKNQRDGNPDDDMRKYINQ